jgi:hypothetical protein
MGLAKTTSAHISAGDDVLLRPRRTYRLGSLVMNGNLVVSAVREDGNLLVLPI